MNLQPNKREQVLPLPVVLISTQSRDGITNIAPWSNFTPVLRPLTEVMLASWIKRDTLTNIRETSEFVVNVPPASMTEAVTITSRNYPPHISEFDEAHLEKHQSEVVSAPGIAGCLAWMECRLIEEIERKFYSIIIGTVEHLEVDEQFFFPDGTMDYTRAEPLSVMLGSKGYEFVIPKPIGKSACYSDMIIKGDTVPQKSE